MPAGSSTVSWCGRSNSSALRFAESACESSQRPDPFNSPMASISMVWGLRTLTVRDSKARRYGSLLFLVDRITRPIPCSSPGSSCSTFSTPFHQLGQRSACAIASQTSSIGAAIFQIVSKVSSATFFRFPLGHEDSKVAEGRPGLKVFRREEDGESGLLRGGRGACPERNDAHLSSYGVCVFLHQALYACIAFTAACGRCVAA